MPEEFRAVTALLQTPQATRLGTMKACRGSAAGHDVLVVETGMGFTNAARAAEVIIESVAPSLLISAGFCGGIAPNLLVGDVVVARELYIATDNTIEAVSIRPADAGRTLVARSQMNGRRIFGGVFAGTPAIMQKSELARLLPERASNAVVEMESCAIAIIAAEAGIPLIALRSVSDPYDEELGFSLDEFCDSRMRIRPHKVLLTILRKPRIIPQLIRLARTSRIAAQSLGTAVEELLPLL